MALSSYCIRFWTLSGTMMTVFSSMTREKFLLATHRKLTACWRSLSGQVDGQVGVPEGVVVEEVDAGDAAERLEDRAERDLVAEAQVERLAGAFEPDGALELLAVLGGLLRRGHEGLELGRGLVVLGIEEEGLLITDLGLFLLVLGRRGSWRCGGRTGWPRSGPGRGPRGRRARWGARGPPSDIAATASFVVLVHLGPDALTVVDAERLAGHGHEGQDHDQGGFLHGRSPCFANVLVSPVGPRTTMASSVTLTTL